MNHSTLKISGLLAAALMGAAISLPVFAQDTAVMTQDTVVIESTTGPSQYYIDKHPDLWPSRQTFDGPGMRHSGQIRCPGVACQHE